MSNKQDHKRWRREFNENCLICSGLYSCKIPFMANGITVCEYHHVVCEDWHVAGVCENGYHPDDLYALIRSSYKIAYQASLNLK